MVDAYIYQGDLICKSCARDLKKMLGDLGKEDTRDSGDYPQGPYSDGGGEADNPIHCGGERDCLESLDLGNNVIVGKWLENPLTKDGLQYVAEKLADNFHSPSAQQRLLANFWRSVYHDDLMSWLAGRLIKLSTTTDQRRHEFVDCDYCYDVDTSPNLGDQGHGSTSRAFVLENFLLGHNEKIHEATVPTNSMTRWEIDNDGIQRRPRTVVVPEEVMKGSSPERMLRDAIDEGAFE
jgi:hypothetical protein